MPDESNRTAFDKLVAGMSLQDRSELLERINPGTASVVQFVETENQLPEKYLSLHLRFKEESFFYKILGKFAKQTMCRKFFVLDIMFMFLLGLSYRNETGGENTQNPSTFSNDSYCISFAHCRGLWMVMRFCVQSCYK